MNPRLAVLGLAVLVGCSRSPSIEGKWKYTPGGLAAITLTFDFKPGGRFVADADDQAGADIQAHMIGTWKLDGDRLVVDATDFEFEGPADKVKTAKAEFEPQKSRTLENLSKGVSGKVGWDGPDKFTTTGSFGPVGTFDRVGKR